LRDREVAQVVVPDGRHGALVAHQFARDVHLCAMQRKCQLDARPRAQALLGGAAQCRKRHTPLHTRLHLGQPEVHAGLRGARLLLDLCGTQFERDHGLVERHPHLDLRRRQLPVAEFGERLRPPEQRRGAQQQGNQRTHAVDSIEPCAIG
jgi:hypothetical protein